MNKVALLSERDRRDLFAAAAERLQISTAIVEKDFWVCWVLDALFSSPQWHDKMIFKGGTSLSKVFGLISRFSEDIDLILDWRLLGITGDEPWEKRSNTSRDRFCREINEKSDAYIAATFAPSFKRELESKLHSEIAVEAEAQMVTVKYPRAFRAEYVLPEIRLEIGPLAAWIPHGEFVISPYCAEVFPEVFDRKSLLVKAILAKRTFWEKATILHQQAMAGKLTSRYSRHYYDLALMARSAVKDEALSDLSLLDEVVSFKQLFYPSTKARYDLARPGTFRLLPADDLVPDLSEDYSKMKEMIFGDAPSFESIVQSLGVLEVEINSLS